MTLSNAADRFRAPRLLRGAVCAALVLVSPGTLAQLAPRSADDQAAATALYNEGRELLKAGNNAAGCAKFVASMAVSPAASTMLRIAKCDEQDGKLATAFADYTRALGLGEDTPGVERRKALEELARQGLRALEPRLPKLRIVIGYSTERGPKPPGPPPGVRVRRDREDLAASVLGEALPADPGPHQVRASAPGYREETRTVTLEEGKTAVVEIALQRSVDEHARGWSRPVGIALTTVGGVGLGIGAVAGVLSLDKISAIESESMCASGSRCSTKDAAGLSSAKTLGNVSTASFIAGGVLATAGVVLLVLPTGSARVTLGAGRVDLQGSF